MAAPTPVSAYLHSATMVKAGIVLVARLAPTFADVGPWRLLVVVCGGASLVIGGVRALRQQDAKLALAQGTVSQLGLIMILVGLGTPLTTYAGVAVLTAHALFKASLFLTVGIVDHEAGTRDMRRLVGLGRRLPTLAAVGLAAGASMAALPPTFGFVTKEKGLVAMLEAPSGVLAVPALILVVGGSVLTVAYSIRTLDGMFLRGTAPADGPLPRRLGAPVDLDGVHRPTAAFLASPAVLAVLSVVLGLAAAPVGTFLADVASSLDPASAEGKLVLWPGLGEPLALSALTWVLGFGIAWLVHGRERGADAVAGFATRAYAATYDGLISLSRRVTAVTQSGSLLAYLGVILTSVLVALAAAWWVGDRPMFPDGLPIADSALQVVLAVFVGVLALAVLGARRRFTAALLLGGSGFGLSLLFLSWGAPDLAVTQFMVETLTIVLFLLVLARLPDRFDEPPTWVPRAVRIGLSVGIGVMVTSFALAASDARTEPSVGDDYLALTEPEGGGRNAVNVILIDFRGFDTQGEITVLAVAAVGVVNLVRVARQEQRRKRLADGTDLPDPSDGSEGSDGGGVPTPDGREVVT
jgi:multicomponent Na+:H+ antiporter subunit A